jgi:hypothetical protein
MPASLPELKKAFEAQHVYSRASEAVAKRKIDMQIIGGDYARGEEISLENEAYLKRLIQLASGSKYKVSASRSLQFFIIRAGAEGFLPTNLAGKDAGNVASENSTTSTSAVPMRFDHNDLLVVFDEAGKLISAARLERPLFISGLWSQKTANRVYDAWDGKEVFIYKNTSFEVPYLGLGVRDGFREKRVVVDMHKQEDTNGCIFIVDPKNKAPAVGDPALGSFEPQLIKSILLRTGRDIAAVGRKQIPLGTMRVVSIR